MIEEFLNAQITVMYTILFMFNVLRQTNKRYPWFHRISCGSKTFGISGVHLCVYNTTDNL